MHLSALMVWDGKKNISKHTSKTIYLSFMFCRSRKKSTVTTFTLTRATTRTTVKGQIEKYTQCRLFKMS